MTAESERGCQVPTPEALVVRTWPAVAVVPSWRVVKRVEPVKMLVLSRRGTLVERRASGTVPVVMFEAFWKNEEG